MRYRSILSSVERASRSLASSQPRNSPLPTTDSNEEAVYLEAVDSVNEAIANAMGDLSELREQKDLDPNVMSDQSWRSQIETTCDDLELACHEMLDLQATMIYRGFQHELATAAELLLIYAGTLRVGIDDNDENQFQNADNVAIHAVEHISRSNQNIHDFSQVLSSAGSNGFSESRYISAVAKAIASGNRERCKFCDLQKAEDSVGSLGKPPTPTHPKSPIYSMSLKDFLKMTSVPISTPTHHLTPSLIERIVAQIDQQEQASRQILSLEPPRSLQSAHRELTAVADINLRAVKMQRNLLEDDSNDDFDERVVMQEANDLAARQTRTPRPFWTIDW